MSEEESGANQIEAVKTKEEAERKFGCPCGKWYLSYPALFTHVKQKHDGKPPGALIKPKTDKARGRPRLPTTVHFHLFRITRMTLRSQLTIVLRNSRKRLQVRKSTTMAISNTAREVRVARTWRASSCE